MTQSKMFRTVMVVLLAVAISALAACGGTKVYTADKNVVYRGSIYNLSSVQKISTREEAKLENGDIVALDKMNKDQLEKFFKDNPETMVSMTFDLDDQEVPYLRMQVENYREYKRLKNRFEDAQDDLMDFMGDKKETQLKLK